MFVFILYILLLCDNLCSGCFVRTVVLQFAVYLSLLIPTILLLRQVCIPYGIYIHTCILSYCMYVHMYVCMYVCTYACMCMIDGDTYYEEL